VLIARWWTLRSSLRARDQHAEPHRTTRAETFRLLEIDGVNANWRRIVSGALVSSVRGRMLWGLIAVLRGLKEYAQATGRKEEKEGDCKIKRVAPLPSLRS
jgi:hypothetical protein